MYRNTVFFSETPIENSKENIMLENDFKEFMKKLSKNTTLKSLIKIEL